MRQSGLSITDLGHIIFCACSVVCVWNKTHLFKLVLFLEQNLLKSGKFYQTLSGFTVVYPL